LWRDFGGGPCVHPIDIRLVRNLESFDAWKCGRQLAQLAYQLTMQPPLAKHFALADQIRRAAISIPANIAEGYALGTTPQFLRCLRISLGSTAELRAHVDLGHAMHLVEASDTTAVLTLCDRMLGILLGLIRKLSHP
jgi:four helix bundle protein